MNVDRNRQEDRPVALVTGATGGIGGAIARALALDHTVIAVGRDIPSLQSLGEVDNIRATLADLLDLDSMARLIRSLDRLDVLVHSAAMSSRFTVEDADAAEWRRQLELNVVVPGEVTRFALPLLRESTGQVIFINSGAGLRSYGGHTLYSATKHALKAMADGLRAEELDRRVRVASVFPGPTETAMLAGDLRKAGRPFETGAYIDPESIARTVRTIVDLGSDAQLVDVSVRPRRE
ncbi:SDR family oxidoreductase [Leifsonia shinshuensis]|uniref:SDR family oxidoreductase n=1 Tax=Leifsonia shinshuensis TaxID=150026 RepID=A0A7G6YE37_9MICO|nr:SDR family oxidoreductase [Leifsonia shinshuensis]QNE36752.1 SDR family oxidoreductase [Leifsonia shinshuensis]